MGCASGILKNALAEVQQKIKEEQSLAEATLSLDEMAIKKGIYWDSKLNKYFGFHEFPNINAVGSDQKKLSVATQALVYYLVSMDGRWKTPIAYYFTNHVDSKRLAGLTKKIIKESANYDDQIHCVRRIAGQHPNDFWARCKPEISWIDFKSETRKKRVFYKKNILKAFKPYFLHPLTQEPVYVLLDACHMLKLARNLLAMPQGVVLPNFKTPAQWKYINELFEFQNKTGFRLGNRLTRKHAYFQRHKMKVSLAAQVLSQSVADTLWHLREDLKVPVVIIKIYFWNCR